MIGDIVEEQRLLLGMSRKELAKGICSDKYVYLIERNERNPSTYILNSFSERLGLDLFEYYQFLNYGDKTKVFRHREQFERFNQTSDVIQLKAESLEASKIEAFQKEPLMYDILVIDCTYKAIVLGKTAEAIQEMVELIETKELNIDPITLINAYVTLATAYQIEEKWESAKEVIETAFQLVKNKKKFTRYNTVIISVLISITSLLYNMEEFEELIQYSDLLMSFHEKYSEYNRFYYVDYYLAFAYYKTNELEKSYEHFMRGGYSALLFKSKIDMEFIVQMPGFKETSENLKVNPEFIKQLSKIIEITDK